MVKQLAERLRPQLEAAVKQNESASGDAFIPGDFNQVWLSTATFIQPLQGIDAGWCCSPSWKLSAHALWNKVVLGGNGLCLLPRQPRGR